MKKIKFLLIAVATFGFISFYSCNGAADDEAAQDSTEVATDEPVVEETADTTAVVDSISE